MNNRETTKQKYKELQRCGKTRNLLVGNKPCDSTSHLPHPHPATELGQKVLQCPRPRKFSFLGSTGSAHWILLLEDLLPQKVPSCSLERSLLLLGLQGQLEGSRRQIQAPAISAGRWGQPSLCSTAGGHSQGGFQGQGTAQGVKLRELPQPRLEKGSGLERGWDPHPGLALCWSCSRAPRESPGWSNSSKFWALSPPQPPDPTQERRELRASRAGEGVLDELRGPSTPKNHP